MGKVVPHLVASRITNAEFLKKLFPKLASHEVLWWHQSSDDHKTSSRWGGQKSPNPDLVPDNPKQNTFYSPSLYDNGNGSASRTKDYFSRLCVIVLDDINPSDLAPLPPTYLLQTSPTKFQAGYKLAEPISDPETASSLISSLVAGGTYKKDKSGNNLVRYVRLPVGTNTHYGEAAHQRLIDFHPDRTFSAEQLLGFFGAEPEPEKQRGQWQGLLIEAKHLKRNKAGKIMDGGRKELIRRWQMALANEGKTADEIEEQITDWIEHSFDATWTEQDWRNTVTSGLQAVRKVAREQRKADPVDEPEELPDDLLQPPNLQPEWEERPWAFKPYFLRGTVVTINAPGGTGKSALVAALAAHMASKKPFGPLLLNQSCRSVIVTYEDSRDEYSRKLVAIPEIDGSHIMDNVRIIDGSTLSVDQRWWTARINGTVEATGAASELAEVMKPFKPDVVFLDTLSQLNGGDEDNATFAKIISSAQLMAKELDCCVVLVHHTGKEVARAGIVDQYSGRGGSAVSDNARSVLQLITIDPDSAKKVWPGKVMELPKDTTMVALVHVKSNYARAADPIAFLRQSDPATKSFYLKLVDTSNLPTAPTKEEKLATDADIAVAWLRGQTDLVTLKRIKDWPASDKPAGLKGSLKAALLAALNLGLVRLEDCTNRGRKTQAYVVSKEGE